MSSDSKKASKVKDDLANEMSALKATLKNVQTPLKVEQYGNTVADKIELLQKEDAKHNKLVGEMNLHLKKARHMHRYFNRVKAKDGKMEALIKKEKSKFAQLEKKYKDAMEKAQRDFKFKLAIELDKARRENDAKLEPTLSNAKGSMATWSEEPTPESGRLWSDTASDELPDDVWSRIILNSPPRYTPDLSPRPSAAPRPTPRPTKSQKPKRMQVYVPEGGFMSRGGYLFWYNFHNRRYYSFRTNRKKIKLHISPSGGLYHKNKYISPMRHNIMSRAMRTRLASFGATVAPRPSSVTQAFQLTTQDIRFMNALAKRGLKKQEGMRKLLNEHSSALKLTQDKVSIAKIERALASIEASKKVFGLFPEDEKKLKGIIAKLQVLGSHTEHSPVMGRGGLMSRAKTSEIESGNERPTRQRAEPKVQMSSPPQAQNMGPGRRNV